MNKDNIRYFYASGVNFSTEDVEEIKAIKQSIIIHNRFRTLASKPTDNPTMWDFLFNGEWYKWTNYPMN